MAATNPFDFEDEYSDSELPPDDGGRYDDAEEDDDGDFDAWARKPEQIAKVLAGTAGKQVEPRRRDMLADLVSASEDEVKKELEKISMALQRKNANIWNAFCGVVFYYRPTSGTRSAGSSRKIKKSRKI